MRAPFLEPVATLCVVGLFPVSLPIQAVEDDATVEWESFEGQARDGSPLTGQLERILVPENRARPEGETIEIAFVRFASSQEDPGPPIFFLIGGPGAPASEFTAGEATMPEVSLLQFGDVIGIDQRGTGLSIPNLSEGPEFSAELPLDRAVTRADRLAAQKDAVVRCAQHWREQGIDLAAYNTVESADDLEAVRDALGYEQIVLWGTSYGSHLGLAYLRRYPQRVARAVLMKVEGPDQTYKLPSRVQTQLERAQEVVSADEGISQHLPDLLESLESLLSQLREAPVDVTLQHPSGDLVVQVGPHDLQCAVAMHIGHAQSLTRLPAFVHGMAQGDWKMLAMAALNLRRVGIDSAMALMMDASSGGSPQRLKQIAHETSDEKNLLGDAMNFNLYPEVAEACGNPDLGAEFRGPFDCDRPVLFVSGSLDGRTPPENVEDIIAGFSQAAHVVVEGTGHDSREWISPEYCQLVRSFLAGETVESQTIQLPPLEFMPIRAR